MIKILVNILILCIVVEASQAGDIYVDNTLVADCAGGAGTSYRTTERDCSGSGGEVAYNTIQDVLWGTDGSNGAANVGDVIILRGGTYTEAYGTSSPTAGAAMQIPTRLNGTESANWRDGTYTTLTSYPGEWAILQGTADYASVVGYSVADSGTETAIRCWKFERLEITGGIYTGIGANGGPFWIRYCYIHENANVLPDGGDQNRSGINMRRNKYTLIEYNLFYKNGHFVGNNPAHIMSYADYLYDAPDYSFDLDIANRDNIIRYNYFTGNAKNGIHDKAAQYLADYVDSPDGTAPGTISDFTNQEHGNKYHHNIFEDIDGPAVYSKVFFNQVYNNISDGAEITNAAGGTERPMFGQCFYNNTVIGENISITSGYDRNDGDLQARFFCVNNIVDGGLTGEYSRSIGLAGEAGYRNSPAPGACELDYDWTGTTVDRNLIHAPISATEHFSLYNSKLGDAACLESRVIDTDEFNTLRSVTNYNNSTDGLFTSGYLTDGTFIVTGSTTIADGGIGGDHPYLSGVTIPSYVGATNPNDNSWVAGALAMDVAYFTDRSSGETPSWVEGAAVSKSARIGSGATTQISSTGATVQIY